MELSLARLYGEHNMRLYHTVGSNSFLDSLVAKTMHEKNYHVIQKVIPKFGSNYYAMVIGDFIFSTKLPNYIHQLMKQIYQNTNKLTNFQPQQLAELITQPARTELTISRNKKSANKFRQEIKSVFKK